MRGGGREGEDEIRSGYWYHQIKSYFSQEQANIRSKFWANFFNEDKFFVLSRVKLSLQFHTPHEVILKTNRKTCKKVCCCLIWMAGRRMWVKTEVSNQDNPPPTFFDRSDTARHLIYNNSTFPPSLPPSNNNIFH